MLDQGIVGSLPFRSSRPRRETCQEFPPFPIRGMDAGLRGSKQAEPRRMEQPGNTSLEDMTLGDRN